MGGVVWREGARTEAARSVVAGQPSALRAARRPLGSRRGHRPPRRTLGRPRPPGRRLAYRDPASLAVHGRRAPGVLPSPARPVGSLFTVRVSRGWPLSRDRAGRRAASGRSPCASVPAVMTALLAIVALVAGTAPATMSYVDVPPEVERIAVYEWRDR